MQSTILRALDAEITKNLRETTAYDKILSRVTSHSSGFFAPRIKADPVVEALRGINNVMTIGDIVPTTFNTIGTVAQTASHAAKLASLSSDPNPFATVTTILASRFLTDFSYRNVTSTTTRKESVPQQSKVKLGDEPMKGVEVLRISNDRTHLEGIWEAEGRAVIETKEFTASAPKHEVSQESKTKGYSVSLPVAAALAFGLSVAPVSGCLPSVSVQNSSGVQSSTASVPTILRADDLFVRCNDAVFNKLLVNIAQSTSIS